jgi:hypothetical protein
MRVSRARSDDLGQTGLGVAKAGASQCIVEQRRDPVAPAQGGPTVQRGRGEEAEHAAIGTGKQTEGIPRDRRESAQRGLERQLTASTGLIAV